MAPITRVVEDGMAVIHEGNEPVVDIVFVHGLQGHPQVSWTAYPRSHSPPSKKKPRNKFKSCWPSRSRSNSPSVKRGRSPENEGVFWPRDLLPQQFKEDNVRILTWGYNSTVLEFFAGTNQNGITHHAKNLLGDLVTVRADVGDRKMILVAHSLGGIIIKEMLRRSQEVQHIASSHAIQAATYAAMFFGTPHRGSPAAQWGLMASRLATLSGASTNRKIVTNLQSDSEILEVGRMSFANFIKYDQIKVHSFLEERGVTGIVGLSGKIVEDVSAVIGDACEGVEGINANHDQMCKFESAESIGFIKTTHVLKKWTKEIAQDAQLRQVEKLKPKPLSQEHKDMLQGFFTSDYMSHRQTLPIKHEGTCQWVFEHHEYRNWHKTEEAVLWISGNPGMGKTLVASTIIDHFELYNSDKQKVIYFFCDDKYDNQRSLSAILRGLIHQLLQIDTANRLEQHVRPHQLKKYHSSLASLWTIFVSLVTETEGTTVCVLDAMDECDETSRGYLFSYLGDLFSDTPRSKNRKGKLKLVFTSRPYDSIRADVLELPDSKILRVRAEAEEELINRDISIYVDAEIERLAKLRHYDEDLKAYVLTRLKARSDGSFLWASLIIRILSKTPIRNVKKRLDALPEELESVYNRIMAEMSQDAIEMLRWIGYATRPLTLADLAIAMAISDDDPETTVYRVDSVVLQRLKGDLELCYPLVKVNTDGETETVVLVHQTAKEFLQQKCDKWGLNPAEANYEIVKRCLTFLRSDNLKRGPTISKVTGASRNTPSKKLAQLWMENHERDTLQATPFLAYAVMYWHKHLEVAEDQYAAELWKPLYRSVSCGPKTQLSLQLNLHLRDSWYCGGETPCHIMARYGFLKMLETCFENVPKMELDVGDSEGSTPLAMVASQTGPKVIKMMDFLLSHGADINKPDDHDSVPLAAACSSGRLENVKYLLEHGALVDVTDASGETPISVATRRGHADVVNFLMGAEQGLEKQPPGFSLLSAAVEGDKHETVQLLLGSGKMDTEMTKRDIFGRTPLAAAAAKGNLQTLQLLLDTGKVDLNVRDVMGINPHVSQVGRTPLMHAAQNGHLEVVKFLVQTGRVDLDAKDKAGRSAVVHAAKENKLEVLKFLSETGKVVLDPAPAEDAWPPIIIAARYGRLEVMEYLVNSAQVNVETTDRKRGRTALGWAARYCHVEIARFLITTGKADMMARDSQGFTPLHNAVDHCPGGGGLWIAQLLVEEGKVCVDAKDSKGRTPLSLAVELSEFLIVDYLLETGKADLTWTDADGQTLPDLARSTAHRLKDLHNNAPKGTSDSRTAVDAIAIIHVLAKAQGTKPGKS